MLSTANAFRIPYLAKRDSRNNMVVQRLPYFQACHSLCTSVPLDLITTNQLDTRHASPEKSSTESAEKSSKSAKMPVLYCIYPILTGKNQPKDVVINYQMSKRVAPKRAMKTIPSCDRNQSAKNAISLTVNESMNDFEFVLRMPRHVVAFVLICSNVNLPNPFILINVITPNNTSDTH